MGRGIELGQLRSIALAVKRELLDLQLLADRLEIFRGLGRRVSPQAGLIGMRLDEAGVDKPRRARSVRLHTREDAAGDGTVVTIRPADPALIPEDEVVALEQLRV